MASVRTTRDLLYAAQPEVGGVYDYITTTAAWKCCGIAGESLEVVAQLNQPPSSDFIHRGVEWEQLIYSGSPGATYFVCSITGKGFINVYGDGSVLFGNSVWHAKVAWGIWVGEANPANAAGMIDVPCSFRAELAAILNCVKKRRTPSGLLETTRVRSKYSRSCWKGISFRCPGVMRSMMTATLLLRLLRS